MGKANSSTAVARGKDVYVQPHARGWEVKKQGGVRASAVTETKAEAIKIARGVARKENSELVIKGKAGAIQQKDSHGHDPRQSKG